MIFLLGCPPGKITLTPHPVRIAGARGFLKEVDGKPSKRDASAGSSTRKAKPTLNADPPQELEAISTGQRTTP